MENLNHPKPVHKTNWMVIILLIIIVAIVAVGIWWWTQDTAKITSLEQQVAQREVKTNSTTVTPTPTVTVTPTATPTPTATADQYAGWKTYTDPKLKISFKYPADWKGIQDYLEHFCANPQAATSADPCQVAMLRATAFENNSGLFAAAQSALYRQYGGEGRGGYWVDEGMKITDLNSVKNYCSNTGLAKCRAYQNANGVTIARSVEPDCSEAGCNGEAVMYYIKLNNDIFPAILFSTASLKEIGIVDLDGKMDKLVDSLKLL